MIILIQLAKWFWALFPALIGIMSPTGAYNRQNNLDLQQSQLVANSDLLIPKASPNENEPLGFVYRDGATDITLVNGIATFTATAQYGRIQSTLTYNVGDTIYYYANVKSNKDLVNLSNNYRAIAYHSGSNNFEFLSGIDTMIEAIKVVSIRDVRTSDWTPIEVDYIGAINLTAVFGDNIPDKEVLDDFILSGERFLFTDETTSDNWFNSGFTSESRDILDIIGYFFWLAMPIICIYWVFRLLLYII